MQEVDKNKQTNDFDDEIDLRELFFILVKGKKIISYLTGSLLAIGIIYSLLLPSIYESKALLAPIDETSSLISSALSQYSGLAGLAGISLPTGDADSNAKKAIEVMKSLSFFENYIMPKIFLPDLFAVKYWENKEDKIIYDDDIFDINTNTWVRKFRYPQKLIPSAQESFEEFTEHYFNLSEDKKSGYVILSIKHQSPSLAKKWVEMFVEEINIFYRQKDKVESEKAVEYLNKQMLKTSFSEIKQATASLLQKEIQKLTLIEANPDYVFEYIYPPSEMEEESEPERFLIIFLFAFFGFFLGACFVLLRYFFFPKKIEAEIIKG